MQVRREANGLFIVSLTRGESIRDKLEAVAAKEQIFGARLSGIGALEDPELGYFDLEKKDYRRKVFAGVWELVSVLGNITLKEGKPFLHAHVSISGEDFNVVGGHFFEARVAVVAELFVSRVGTLRRVQSQDLFGLHCWALGI